MANENRAYFIGLTEIDFSEDNKKPIQILKIGNFKHPIYGEFEITLDDLKEFVKNFKENVRQIKLAINFDHVKTIAAGWFKSLSIKGDKLFMIPDLNADTIEKIRNKEYRYFSPEIFFKYKDSETGKTFRNVLGGGALTNYPFFKGMAEIEATEKNNKPSEVNMTKAELIATLQAEHQINVIELQLTAKNFSETEKSFSEVKLELGVTKAANEKLEKENKEFSEKIETVEKEKKEIALKSLIEKGMKEGKLTKAIAEGSFTEIYNKMGHEFAEKHLKDLPKTVNVDGQDGHGGGGKSTDFSDPEQALILATEKIMSENKEIGFSEACEKALNDNPKLNEALKELDIDIQGGKK